MKYGTHMLLCNDEGMVDGEFLTQHNKLRAATRNQGPWKTKFTCFGDTSMLGTHIRCTNKGHDRPRWTFYGIQR